MEKHHVKQGECLSSLAARYGLSGWKELYNHPANEELKKKRPNPNILAPGDEVIVPERGPTKFESVVTERLHRFELKVAKVKLRVAVVDRLGKAYQGKRFVVN